MKSTVQQLKQLHGRQMLAERREGVVRRSKTWDGRRSVKQDRKAHKASLRRYRAI